MYFYMFYHDCKHFAGCYQNKIALTFLVYNNSQIKSSIHFKCCILNTSNFELLLIYHFHQNTTIRGCYTCYNSDKYPIECHMKSFFKLSIILLFNVFFLQKTFAAKELETLIKTQPLIILNYAPSDTGYNSTSFHIKYYNNSNKTIKYITSKFIGYDAVGGSIKEFNTAIKASKGIGPIKPFQEAEYIKNNAWFTDIVQFAKVVSITIEYMDGTIKNIANPSSITLSDAGYAKLQENEDNENHIKSLRCNMKYYYLNYDYMKNHRGQKIIKIGHVAPLTGGISFLGVDNENGACLAIEEINKNGLEINGEQIALELRTEDDGGNPREAVIAAKKLVNDGVVAVVGHLNSGASISASTIYNNANIVQISPSSTNPEYTAQGFKSTYRLIASDDKQGVALAEYATKILHAKTVAIVDDATAYGKGLADEFKKTAKENGAKILAHEETNDKAIDFKSILTKIKNKGPDIIMFSGMDATGGIFVKQADKLGIKSKILSGDGLCTDSIVKLAGNASSNIICSEPGVPFSKMEKVNEFNDKYKKRFGLDAQVYSPFTYDAIYVIVDAMKRANSTNADKILEQMPNTNLKGIIGNISFNSKGDMKDGVVTIYSYINKTKTVLDTVIINNK
jgi:branched-chain amino acid transport system substrate-binding protein